MPVMPAASQPWNTAAFSATAIRWAASSSALEVDVLGAAVGVGELGARDGERRAQLDQRQHAALRGASTPSPATSPTLLGAAEVRRRVLPAVRAAEVDEPARRERGREPLARLVVEQRSSPPR